MQALSTIRFSLAVVHLFSTSVTFGQTVAEGKAAQEFGDRLILPIVFSFAQEGQGQRLSTDLNIFNTSGTTYSAAVDTYRGSGDPGPGANCPYLVVDPPPIGLEDQFILASPTNVGCPALDGLRGWAEVRFRKSLLGPIEPVPETGIEAWSEVAVLQGEINNVLALPFLKSEQPPGCQEFGCRERFRYSASVAAVRPDLAFLAPVSIGRERQSAFSVVNPSDSEDALVSVIVRDGSGFTFKVGLFRVGPLESRVGFAFALAHLCEPAPVCDPPPATFPENGLLGTIEFRGDRPIAVGGIDVVLPEGRFATLTVRAMVGESPKP